MSWRVKDKVPAFNIFLPRLAQKSSLTPQFLPPAEKHKPDKTVSQTWSFMFTKKNTHT